MASAETVEEIVHPLTFRAYGEPAPQGSKNVYRGRVVESSKALRPWRQAVTYAAIEALGQKGRRFAGPVLLDLEFVFERPRGHYGTGRNAGILKPGAPAHFKSSTPDLSKLVRAAEDAITDAGAWTDDALVAKIAAVKRYAGPGEVQGLIARVSIIGPQEER